MNILVLTPDRVGSTLLQRLVTIYANAVQPDVLTVNLHELTNGLACYHNDVYNKELLGKKEKSWGYHQSLSEIVELLETADHDVTSRLAHYHIKNRKDSLADQLSFYEYLNDNFFIIAARRRNLLEHAVSWGITVESKRLNVYSFEEKYETFRNIEKTGINIDDSTLLKYLNQYNEYTDWVDNHFRVNAYFDYEDDLPNIENFILGLSPFRQSEPVTWQDQFGISWNDWNRAHYLLSLVPFQKEFTEEERTFLKENLDQYTKTRVRLQDMQDNGLLVSGIPIKLHTLAEKSKIVHNLDYCVDTYNRWISAVRPSYAIPYTHEKLTELAYTETAAWKFGSVDSLSQISYNDISNEQYRRSDLK